FFVTRRRIYPCYAYMPHCGVLSRCAGPIVHSPVTLSPLRWYTNNVNNAHTSTVQIAREPIFNQYQPLVVTSAPELKDDMAITKNTAKFIAPCALSRSSAV